MGARDAPTFEGLPGPLRGGLNPPAQARGSVTRGPLLANSNMYGFVKDGGTRGPRGGTPLPYPPLTGGHP